MEKFKVFAPRKYKSEIEYICNVVFFEFLDLISNCWIARRIK